MVGELIGRKRELAVGLVHPAGRIDVGNVLLAAAVVVTVDNELSFHGNRIPFVVIEIEPTAEPARHSFPRRGDRGWRPDGHHSHRPLEFLLLDLFLRRSPRHLGLEIPSGAATKQYDQMTNGQWAE